MAAHRVHEHVPSLHYHDEGLLGVRRASDYNSTERQFSMLLYGRLEQLLKGQRNKLLVLRTYPHEPDRLGAMPTPAALDRTALRIDRVERMATDVLAFLSARAPGGPVAQQLGTDGSVSEIRKYPTRYPHIIIERTDYYGIENRELPEQIQWSARRVQNQRRTMRFNHMLDLAGIGVDVAKLFI